MKAANLRVIPKPVKLRRPIGTSVAYVSYIPKQEHLSFSRQMNRSTGQLEKTKMLMPWSRIGGFVLGGLMFVAIVMVML